MVFAAHVGAFLAFAADLRVATIFREHAVLQRDSPLPIWGWSDPGEEVVVSFGGQEKAARADAEGRWSLTLDPMVASAQPRDISVRGRDTLTIRDVLVGEVWLASGQSNMGYSLALAARRVAYGEDIIASGPLYSHAEFAAGAARIGFTETASGLTIGRAPWLPAHLAPLPGDRLTGFALAGEDRIWVEAEARIEGNTVVVSSTRVPQPVAVRYGWANAPRCNLANSNGLPASPFRSDDWPPVEAPR